MAQFQFNQHILRSGILVIAIIVLFHSEQVSASCDDPYQLVRPLVKNVEIPKSNIECEKNFQIFCDLGERKQFSALWTTHNLHLTISGTNFEIFQGTNVTDVYRQFKKANSFYHILPWRTNLIRLPVFNSSCVGISTKEHYRVKLEVLHVDFWKLSRLGLGLVLFFSAGRLCRNEWLFFGSGTVVGILASLLIVVYVMSKMIPKKVGAISVLVGGWAMTLYFLQFLYANLRPLVTEYSHIAFAYVCTAGIVSFAICYRIGPVTDQRSLDLIKWGLQIAGLVSIFFSTEWQEAGMAIIIAVLIIHNFPQTIIRIFKEMWRKRFPPKANLLSEEEFNQQGAFHTKKALEELRSFCNSPDCNSWKVMRQLHTPIRFAEFAGGADHLTNDEIMSYDRDGFDLNEDDDDSDSIENSLAVDASIVTAAPTPRANVIASQQIDLSEDETVNSVAKRAVNNSAREGSPITNHLVNSVVHNSRRGRSKSGTPVRIAKSYRKS